MRLLFLLIHQDQRPRAARLPGGGGRSRGQREVLPAVRHAGGDREEEWPRHRQGTLNKRVQEVERVGW